MKLNHALIAFIAALCACSYFAGALTTFLIADASGRMDGLYELAKARAFDSGTDLHGRPE